MIIVKNLSCKVEFVLSNETIKVLEKCLEQSDLLTSEAPALLRLSTNFMDDCTFLYDIYRAMEKNVEQLDHFDAQVSFRKVGQNAQIGFGSRVIELTNEQLKQFSLLQLAF